MELLNLTKDDIFKKKDIDDSNKIDFYESYSDTGIYNKEAYLQDRPIYNEFMKNYSIEPESNNFNKTIHERKVKEEKEIAENLAEISITRDPRITKYEDTYSLTPYATYLLTPLSDIDGEDIVSRFDSCYGEWVNKKECDCNELSSKGKCYIGGDSDKEEVDRTECTNNDNRKDCHRTNAKHTCKWKKLESPCNVNTEPCKRIKQHFKIHNPGYTGEHCRDEDGRRLRRGDTKHVFCNHYQNPKCNGHGKCIRNTIGTSGSNTCYCNGSYSGPNCETAPDPCKNINCLKSNS